MKLFRAGLSVSAATSVWASPVHLSPRASGSLSTWIYAEGPVALQGVLNNIGSDGLNAHSAKPGIVIASPSTTNPNCKLSVQLLR